MSTANCSRRSWRYLFVLAASVATVSLCSVRDSLAEEPVQQRPLMRFPDVYGNMVVFVYGEDIWLASTSGGVARRLTIHDGEEQFPKFSPDGKLIAFTGEYDGNGDVYVMNVDGGNITRVTYHPGYDEVVGWHPAKNKILFRSRRDSFQRFDRLFLISPDGTGLEELILHEAATGSFSPDGSKIAYSPQQLEGHTWKRYRGGLGQQVYIYDFTTNENRQITNPPGENRNPMWIGDKVYFTSDRDRVLNVYSFDPKTGATEQLTHHTDYDVRRSSDGGNSIVYELGGTLWLLDVAAKQTKQIPIEIRADAAEARPRWEKVDDLITGFGCSPDGKRALLVARGEVFTVPKKDGPIRNLTQDSGARDKDAVWSPDGKTIAYLSDKSGEYEIYLVDPLQEKEPVRLTTLGPGHRHTLRWSPDSKKLAFTDQTLRLSYIDVATKKITEVDEAEYQDQDVSLDLKPIADFAWSPDSRFIAYAKMDSGLVYQIYIHGLETGTNHCVSSGIFNDVGPVFSRDGEHLFFISNRRFDATFCDFEWEMVYKQVAGIYCLTLKKDGAPLLPFKSDEAAMDTSKTAAKKSEGKGEKKTEEPATPTVVIDFDGLAERIEALPLPRGNYRNLAVDDSLLFYLNADSGDFNRFEFRAVGPRRLCAFSLSGRKEKVVVEGIDGYEISANGSHIIYRKGKSFNIIKADGQPVGEASESGDGELNLSDLKMWLDPLAEWTQMYNEAWRLERDFYYEPNMHGMNWPAMREKYGRLLPYASCRQDLRYLIAELIGELGTSHTYVYGGDRERRAAHVNVGLLGVDWEADAANNRYRFKKIYRVADWTDEVYPPLAKPGMNIQPGDYLLKVNGVDVTASREVYAYFQDLADKQVTILVNSKPTEIGAKEYVVKPLADEYTLRYQDWMEHNRQVVEQASGGLIGYLHLPDTYTGSATEFPKYFYSQTQKKGLIIDGRFNGGGLDPDIFLQRLDKKLLTYWTRRYSHDQTTPAIVTRAHMVCLTNRQAGSGGDMLPMEFQMRKMGPVIGTRTWGGLVGYSAALPLVDGGEITAPDYRVYDPSGKWIVENVGIQPDVVVDLQPAEVARGYDAQLMKGVEVLMQKIKEDPRPWPQHEPFPVDK